MIRDAFPYQSWYKSSRAGCGSVLSHTFGKAPPSSQAHTRSITPTALWCLSLTDGSDRWEYQQFLPAGAPEELDHWQSSGMVSTHGWCHPSQHPWPIKEKGSRTWKTMACLPIRGLVKPLSRDKHGFAIYLATFRAPEGQTTASQANLYQLRAGSMVKHSQVCQSGPSMTPTKSVHFRCTFSLLPAVPFLLAPFSLLLPHGPGKQSRGWLHLNGRWVNPAVLFFHQMHETTFQTSLMLLS